MAERETAQSVGAKKLHRYYCPLTLLPSQMQDVDI